MLVRAKHRAPENPDPAIQEHSFGIRRGSCHMDNLTCLPLMPNWHCSSQYEILGEEAAPNG
jgi:hypothetical protein